MYEFHAWFLLDTVSSGEEKWLAAITSVVGALQPLVDEFNASVTSAASVRWLNGECFLMLNGLAPRRRWEADRVNEVITLLAQRLNRAYGILYERDSEIASATDSNTSDFTVKVLTRGQVTLRPDPFLSPYVPVATG